jgi:hypothetical protein
VYIGLIEEAVGSGSASSGPLNWGFFGICLLATVVVLVTRKPLQGSNGTVLMRETRGALVRPAVWCQTPLLQMPTDGTTIGTRMRPPLVLSGLSLVTEVSQDTWIYFPWGSGQMGPMTTLRKDG